VLVIGNDETCYHPAAQSGLAAARGDTLVLLNNDLVLTAGGSIGSWPVRSTPGPTSGPRRSRDHYSLTPQLVEPT